MGNWFRVDPGQLDCLSVRKFEAGWLMMMKARSLLQVQNLGNKWHTAIGLFEHPHPAPGSLDSARLPGKPPTAAR